MKPAIFAYHDPRSLADVNGLLAEIGEESVLLAGGQSLVPMMNLRLAQPAHVIDLNRVEGLDYIREDGGALAIGAMTRHAAVERSEAVARRLPLLAQAVPKIAYPSIRNRGTTGGSLAHADPNAELPCAALALEATMVLESARGRREVGADSFFKGAFTTDRAPEELLVEIRFPIRTERRVAFREYARKEGDFGLVLVGAVLEMEGSSCRSAVIALGGVAPSAMRARRAEASLAGRVLDGEAIAAAASLAAGEADPVGDIHASAAYRRRLVAVEVRRALEQAAGSAA